MRLAYLTLFIPVLAYAGPPDGKQIVLHGNGNGAMPCAACHGVAGAGNAAIGAPALAGLPAGAIAGALAQFAKGDGGTPLMQSIAQALSPEETNAVAAYFAGLRPGAPSPGSHNPDSKG
jgi:cytochrome c553